MPMLTELVSYARKHGLITEPGFAPKTVRWAIAVPQAGGFPQVIELGRPGEKRNRGQEFARCPEMPFSAMKSGEQSGRRSHFLVESAEVVGLYGDGAKDERIQAKHSYFTGLLRKAATVMPELEAAADCLDDPSVLERVRQQLSDHRAKPGDKVTLRIGGRFPVDDDAWHDWWRTFLHGLAAEAPARAAKGSAEQKMRCFATGDLVVPARTHPQVGGLGSVGGRVKCSLISFNEAAFESGGLSQSANYAVSEEAATAYRSALDRLLATQAETLAGARVAYWFKESVRDEDNPILALLGRSLTSGDQQELDAYQRVRDLLTALRAGKRPDLGTNRFYGLTLSGAQARAVVRDWMEGRFEELVENVTAWFDDLTIVRREGGGLAPVPKFFAVLSAMVRDPAELPPPLVTKMWRVALRREPIPFDALSRSLARARVAIVQDEPASHARMGLIKAYHVRQSRQKGGHEMSEQVRPYLNEEHPSAAYHCGRLMAVLAALQRAALGDVGAGVVQRYYAAASATPALVLGRLVRTSQFHLNKLEGGLAHWYESKLAGIWGRLRDTVPATLSLEEQSLFALGYYQQLADLRTRKAAEQEPEDVNTETERSESDNESGHH